MSSVPNQAPIVISAGGPIQMPPPSAELQLYNISGSPAAGILNISIPAPPEDGIMLQFVDEVGFAHRIVCTGAGSPATAGLNSGTTNNQLLFNGARGSSCILESRNGFWWTVGLNGVTVS